MNLSLTGEQYLNEHTLLGRSVYYNKNNVQEIKKIKTKIMNQYLIPLFKKQWSKIYENLVFLEPIKRKLAKYKNLYNTDDLQLYNNLIQLLELVAEKNKLMEEKERNDISSSNNNRKEQLISMVFKMTPIRLLPEYELYNTILGKPKRELKQTYDMEKINTIKRLLLIEDMDFDKMKSILEEVYPSEDS